MRFFSRCISQIVEIKISIFDKTDYAYGSRKDKSSILLKHMTNLEKIRFEKLFKFTELECQELFFGSIFSNEYAEKT